MAPSDCFDCGDGPCTMNCGPVGTPLDVKAKRAVDALRAPSPAFAKTPNTVRQATADVIEEMLHLLTPPAAP